jgi:hypothetical protein
MFVCVSNDSTASGWIVLVALRSQRVCRSKSVPKT